MASRSDRISLLVKIPYSIFFCVLVPVYWRNYGASNFLWFSDLALGAMLVALWCENRLLASVAALATLVPELVWNADFVTGGRLLGSTSYMFDPKTPIYLRSLSLFHIALPALLLWTLYRLGYDRSALLGQTAVAWIVFPLTFLLTDPQDNVNWVYGLGEAQTLISPLAYLSFLMIFVPTGIYLPTHLALESLFGKERPRYADSGSPSRD